MADGRFRLTDMELDFVSLVPAGDDPLAQVVIAKAAPTSGNENKSENQGGSSITISPNNLNPEERMGIIKKDDLAPDVLDYVEGLETEVATLSEQVEKSEAAIASKDTEIETLRKEADASITKSEADREKDLLAKADPAVRALIEKANKEAENATNIAKAEREARLTREYLAKAEGMPNVAVTAKDGETGTQALAGLLRRAADALTPEDTDSLEKAFASLNTQVAKSLLLKEIGNGGAETTLTKSVEAKASELMKSDPALTKEMALVKVYESDPDLAMKIENGEDA